MDDVEHGSLHGGSSDGIIGIGVGGIPLCSHVGADTEVLEGGGEVLGDVAALDLVSCVMVYTYVCRDELEHPVLCQHRYHHLSIRLRVLIYQWQTTSVGADEEATSVIQGSKGMDGEERRRRDTESLFDL